MSSNADPSPSLQTILTKVVDSVANLEFITELIEDHESSELLMELVEARRERIEDLSWLLLSHEAQPKRDSSQNFIVHRAWVKFIKHLLNPPDHQLISECAKSDRMIARSISSHLSKVPERSARMLKGIAEELNADAALLDRMADIVRAHKPAPRGSDRLKVWLGAGGGRGDDIQAA